VAAEEGAGGGGEAAPREGGALGGGVREQVQGDRADHGRDGSGQAGRQVHSGREQELCAV